MRHLTSSLPPHLLLALLLLCLLLLLMPLARPRLQAVPACEPELRRCARRWGLGYWTAAALGCLVMLSGCGTAPSRVCTCPEVPAELMEEPQKPVPLQRSTPSKTCSTTT